MYSYVVEDIGGREYNEDRHCVETNLYKDYSLYAVFDGHGDDKVATFAKQYLKEVLKTELQKDQSEELSLYNSLKILNNLIPEDIGNNSGSTVVMLLKKGAKYWVANVGDSRAIINSNDKAIAITEDHKPGVVSELNRIRDLGGFVFNMGGVPRVMGNLALSRALGDFNLAPYVTWEPEIFRLNCNDKNQFIILATDGLWDVMSNDEVVHVLYNKNINNIKSACNDLMSMSRLRGSTDNITIMYLLL